MILKKEHCLVIIPLYVKCFLKMTITFTLTFSSVHSVHTLSQFEGKPALFRLKV